jgi:hypothetical protein
VVLLGLRRLLLILVVVLAVERVAELAHAPAHRARDLRQTRGTEDDQRDDQYDDQLEGADVEHAGARIVLQP